MVAQLPEPEAHVLENLRFLDGLVWTVDLTAEINSVFKFLRRSFCVLICKFSTLIFDVTFSKIIVYS